MVVVESLDDDTSLRPFADVVAGFGLGQIHTVAAGMLGAGFGLDGPEFERMVVAKCASGQRGTAGSPGCPAAGRPGSYIAAAWGDTRVDLGVETERNVTRGQKGRGLAAAVEAARVVEDSSERNTSLGDQGEDG